MTTPSLVALDMEGVLLEEVWLAIAAHTGIEKLRLTTRDVSDYDELMRMRLDILNRHGITLADLQSVIAESVKPLPGAVDFLNWIRRRLPVVILSDIFMEFVQPVVHLMEYPTILGNSLTVDPDSGMITKYHIRQRDGKRKAVQALRDIGYTVFAAGDSYNDLTMIQEADAGALFRAPEHIASAHPEIRACSEYAELKTLIQSSLRLPLAA